MLRVFKKVFSPVFMKKDIFDSIMDYCQMKLEYQDLIHDIICTISNPEEKKILTKDFYINKKLIGLERAIKFYIPIDLSNKELKRYISEMEEYDNHIKTTTINKRENAYFIRNLGYYEPMFLSVTSLVVDIDQPAHAECSMYIYNHIKRFVFKGINIDKQTKKYYFCLF